MASQDIKQRTKEDTDTDTMKNNNNNNSKSKTKKQKSMAMAKRGVRSLAIAVTIPLSLTLANIALFGLSHSYSKLEKPFWFPNVWVLHFTCMVSTILMGLSAWLVWADGGFHRKPAALALYLAHLALSLAWVPIVFGTGSTWVGLVVCLAMFAALAECCRIFRDVNPLAGKLVMLCLAWAGFLAIVNLKLIYL